YCHPARIRNCHCLPNYSCLQWRRWRRGPTVDEFAKRLRELREARGLTRYALAKLAGLTNEGVIKMERPGSDPKLSTILKLARALSIAPCDLLPPAATREGKGRKKRPGKVP